MAKKKQKRVSITSVDNVIKEQFGKNVITKDWYGVEIEIYPTISSKDTAEFVDSVASTCFSDTHGYIPEFRDLAIRSNIVLRYSNVSLPDNIEHRHEILYISDIVSFIYKHINSDQLESIVDAIDEKLDYLCDTKITDIENRFNELLSAFESLQEQSANIFDNISGEDLKKVIEAVGESGIDEQKIVKAYIDEKYAEVNEEVE